jgi:hypothetical protein
VTRDEARLALWSAIQLLVVEADKIGTRLDDESEALSLAKLFPEAQVTTEDIRRELAAFGDALGGRRGDEGK